MELIFIVPLVASLGVLVHFLMPGRASLGVTLLPMTALVTGVLLWVALTWAGLGSGSEAVWIAWLAAPLGSIAAAVLLGLVLPRRRAVADQAFVAEFGRA